MKRPCLDCGRTIAKGSLCSQCRTRRYGTGPQRGYNAEWVALSKRMRAEWVEENGWWCPGWGGDPGHEATDLVLDHGPPPQVMCKHHNAVKAGSFDRNSPYAKGGDRPVPEFR